MIVEEALRQATVVGLEGLSLGPLAEALKMSKSGLFAHFRSREALQLAVVDTAVERFEARVIGPALRRRGAAQRLEMLFNGWLRWVGGNGESAGCLFIIMTQEYDARPGALRERLAEFQGGLRALLTRLFREGVAEGVFRSDADPRQCAFELHGLVLSFQHAAHLLDDRKARAQAVAGLRRLLRSLEP